MKKYLFLLILMTGLSLTLSRLNLVGADFEGSWTATGGDSEFAWTQTYQFWAGHYTMDGYPPITDEGTYEVILEDENDYTVKLNPATEDPYLMKFILKQDGTLEMKSYASSGEGITFGKN